ncbi:WhiB family transcriptional regulator [Planobispora rosea]|uniref:WhiB family transcriptional regulator n=1 Tax=Planobispora rosea TaxID=35762 RepID=UPI00083AA5E4|nr:WhiB family transcriptional regulator [Planobispora rosea]
MIADFLATIDDLMTATAWMEQARCAEVDPELWFPEKGGSPRKAQAICADCPVRTECLEWALDAHEEFGVWGGLSEMERRSRYHNLAA